MIIISPSVCNCRVTSVECRVSVDYKGGEIVETTGHDKRVISSVVLTCRGRIKS